MYPLELEICHQMRNTIGIDLAFYEYIFNRYSTPRFYLFYDCLLTHSVPDRTPESLNRLVAVTSDDAQVIALRGETKLDNEEGSWWTMIQVCVPALAT